MKYKRLPGGRRGFFRRSSLWLGDDHVLAVTGWRFTEDYKRYYYRDIHALVLARTPRWAVTMQWILAASLLALAALIASAAAIPFLPDVCWYLLAALALGWLCVSLWGSVRCTIQTAVSRDELPSLVRLRSARRAVATLADRIAQVQGTLVEGWTSHVGEAPIDAPVPVPAPAVSVTAALPSRTGISFSTGALFSSLALAGVLFHHTAAKFWFVPIQVQGGLAAWALVRNEKTHGPRSTRRLMIATLIFVVVMGAAIFASTAAEVFRAAFSRRVVVDEPLNPVLVGVYTAGCLALAVIGVISTILHRKE